MTNRFIILINLSEIQTPEPHTQIYHKISIDPIAEQMLYTETNDIPVMAHVRFSIASILLYYALILHLCFLSTFFMSIFVRFRLFIKYFTIQR